MKRFFKRFNPVDVMFNSLREQAYKTGLEVGENLAIESLRDRQKYDCRNLTEQEKEEVMQYLINNNLEFGYNVENGGFYVLKRKHGK
jgi:hypothetical protein